MTREHALKTPLFAKIVVRLCVPLLFLGIAFSIIQLSNKVSVLNELHQMRSKTAIEIIKNTLNAYSRQIGFSSGDLEDIRNQLMSLSNLHNVDEIQVYDLVARKTLLATTDYTWGQKDYSFVEKGLRQTQGTQHHTVLDRSMKKLVVYIPLREKDSQKIIAARLVFSLMNMKDAMSGSQQTLLIIIIFVFITGLAIAYSLSRSIVKPIQSLNSLTDAIIQGKLGKHVHIKTGDEIETLAHHFNLMSDRLKQMNEQAQDSNPLTGLPGNQGIHDEIQQRIREKRKFTFFHIDIDRFKLFNDHFGLALGDQAIEKTSQVLKEAVQTKGVKDDFIGHQGGDDFVLIARTDHAKELGDYICQLFDQKVRGTLYSDEDLKNGYTLQLDRRGMAETGEKKMREFPLMSISLAGIANTKKEIPDYDHCMKVATKMKKEAKQITESCSLIRDYSEL